MLRIGVCCEVREEYKAKSSDPPDASRDLVSRNYLEEILACLRGMGHTAEWIGDASAILEHSSRISSATDFVFNLSEGLSSPNRASAAPMLLELLGIPYLGSDAYGQAVCLNKYHVETLARNLEISTPGSVLVCDTDELHEVTLPPLPLIIKPVHEGSSLGISAESVVSNSSGLADAVRRIIRDYRQPALVQRFIAGYEVTVPLVGNQDLKFCQLMNVVMDGDALLDRKIYSSDIKYLEDHRVEHLPCKALNDSSGRALKNDVWQLFRFLNLHDYARFDFRVEQSGHYYLIDVNAMAYLGSDGSFARAFAAQGHSYEEMIELILGESIIRQGLQW